MNPKRSLALSALASILVLIAMMCTSMGAVTLMINVSPDPITWDEAFDNNVNNTLNISTGDPVYVSGKISDPEGGFFYPNSMTVDIANALGVVVSHQVYSEYILGGSWNMIGSYGPNSYLSGPMSQGGILVGLATLDPTTPLILPIGFGETWTLTMSVNFVDQQPPVTSIATVTNIPELGSALLAFVGFTLLLRRRR
jgi:hypothetical protein